MSETIVQRSCPECGKSNSVKVDTAGYQAWASGEKIQVALPTLTIEQREILITGLDDACFQRITGGQDD
jgi:uncharacterized protein (DUF169 family)